MNVFNVDRLFCHLQNRDGVAQQLLDGVIPILLIAAAGMAAHLAGALAAQTVLPVIGIPCQSATLDGIDALLSTVQMPSGIPVATVAIGGGVNAALLAVQILAVSDETLREKLKAKRAADSAAVLAKDRALSEREND